MSEALNIVVDRSRYTRWLEQGLWYCFLLLIAGMSFLTAGYAGQAWLIFSAVFYLWLSALILAVPLGAKLNWQALRSSKMIISLLLLSLVWLYLQLSLPLSSGLFEKLTTAGISNAPMPTWFQPDMRWSVVPEKTRWLMMSELILLTLFVSTLLIVNSRRKLKQFLAVLLLLGAVHASIGLIGKLTGVILVDTKQLDGHFSAARGLFINRNHFAALIVLTLVGGLAFQFKFLISHHHFGVFELVKKQLLSRMLFVLMFILLSSVAIISSESRGAFLSLLVASVVVSIVLKGSNTPSLKVFLLPLLIVIVISLIYFGQELLARFSSDSLSLGERSEQWALTLKAILDNPLRGYGGGSYSTVFQVYRVEADLRQVVFAQSHNYFLHIWLEQGLVGLLIWGAIIVLSMLAMIKNHKLQSSSLSSASLLAVLICVLAALVQSMVDFNLQAMNLRAYFVVLLGLSYAIPSIKHRK